MGLGAGTGSGIDPFITNKQVVFMGDSTFFHSGQIAISNAIKLGQDITFIILDNRTTAMTGHQPTPGVEYDILGNSTPTQSIDEIIKGMTVEDDLVVVRADPEKRQPYACLLEETFLADGVKVIIADKECGITRGRRRRRQHQALQKKLGFIPHWEHMNVNLEACRFCLACAELTGCPGLKHVQTDYGQKIDTDVTWCINDGACERLGACSAFEHVTIKRKRPPRSRVPELGLDQIPEPQKRAPGDLWRCCLVGVGGMGIGVATSIVVRAGHKEGYHVLFVDKKGLAIRNGGVVSQVVYNKASQPVSAVPSFGKADLLIGIDILEAARAMDPKARVRVVAKDRTAAVINTDKVATIRGIMGQEDFEIEQLEALIRQNTRGADYLARNISEICQKYLGSKLYANIMMLGFAFQKGLIPVSMHSMAWAIKDTIRTDFRKNLYAFNMGRKLVVDKDLFQGAPQRATWRQTLEDKCRYTIRRYRNGQNLAGQLRELAAGTVASAANLDESLQRAIVIRLYDCMRWGGIEYAKKYAQGVLEVYIKDASEFGYAATRAVVFNLANAMLIKDGVFLAELATSPEKYARDRQKYNINPANGDRIIYRHLWHGTIGIGPWRHHVGMGLSGWMLKMVKRCRWVRKLFPNWHKQEKRYLQQYRRQLATFDYHSPAGYRRQLMQLESAECMNCTNPRCQEQGCPLHNHVPQWVQLAYQDRWQEAAEMLQATNNFPEFTSRICPATCQDACKQQLVGYPVQIKHIEAQIIDRAFEAGWVRPVPVETRTGQRVAVVGSGPAGLACAQQLTRAGHDVVVFEKEQKLGGLLRYGIPDFRLEKSLIDRRLEQMQEEGVSFRTGVEVGKDISARELREEFDAICLATGAASAKDLDLPGRRKQGIYFALELLRQENLRAAGQPVDSDGTIEIKGKVAVVLGGGETGEDCIEMLWRRGAVEIHQWEVLPQPAERISKTKNDPENIHRRWKVKTTAFLGEDERLSGLSAVRVDWTDSPTGPRMQKRPGSRFHIDADLVILAIGFEPYIDKALVEPLSLETDEVGRVKGNGHGTGVEDVFVAGDLATGPAYVVTAIDSGRNVAVEIEEYLKRRISETKQPEAISAV